LNYGTECLETSPGLYSNRRPKQTKIFQEAVMKFNTAKTVLILTVVFIFLTITRAQAAPGDLDPSFGSGGKVVIPANTVPSFVRVQADGKIMTVGAYPYGGTAYISRSNANGT